MIREGCTGNSLHAKLTIILLTYNYLYTLSFLKLQEKRRNEKEMLPINGNNSD